MSEEKKNIELTKDQLGEVAGGGGKKGYETVSCPYCGKEKEVRMDASGTVTCSVCGREFKT